MFRMYVAKIPGTKYMTSLESHGGQWFLRLKLDAVVEAEEDINQLNKRNLQNSLNDLFKQVNLQINTFQIDLILKELIVQVQHLILQDQSNSRSKTIDNAHEQPKYDPRVDLLLEKIEELEGVVKTLSDRIDRMHMISQ